MVRWFWVFGFLGFDVQGLALWDFRFWLVVLVFGINTSHFEGLVVLGFGFGVLGFDVFGYIPLRSYSFGFWGFCVLNSVCSAWEGY